VGLAIGLLVALAALGILVHARQATMAVAESTRMQQDASTAMRILGHQLQQAGTPGLEDTAGGQVVFRQDFSGEDPSTWGVSGTDGGALAPDTLNVSHGVDTAMDNRDCLGQSPAGSVIRSSFRVAGQELQCLGSASRPTYQALISGVEDFQVWYGQRQGTALQYLSASAVTQWPAVVSVQVCLRLVGELRTHPMATEASAGCQDTATVPSDGRLRRVFRQVFSLSARSS
jgi:type IV pilus assembly protein PilW